MGTDTDATPVAGHSMPEKPPRENLFRAAPPVELVRADGDDDGLPTLAGHFAVFDEWAEIHSMWEGHFLERIAPGAFKKTFREQRDQMRVLFQHGQDPTVGDKVLGPIAELREDETGGYYEVPLLDTSYNRDLLPGLEAGLYGASFRFRVLREELVDEPDPSEHNPYGLPERTIKEAQVREFGPVTFPAYKGATAGVRSLTDEFVLGRLLDDPEALERVLSAVGAARQPTWPWTPTTSSSSGVSVSITGTATNVPANAAGENMEREEAPDAGGAAREGTPPRSRRSTAPGTTRPATGLATSRRKETPRWRL